MQHFHQSYHTCVIKFNLSNALTSVDWFDGVGLGVAPSSTQPILQPEGAALVIEPSPFLEGAEQLVQCLWEVRG